MHPRSAPVAVVRVMPRREGCVLDVENAGRPDWASGQGCLWVNVVANAVRDVG